MRIIVRVVSGILFVIAATYWYRTSFLPGFFASGGFLLTFLGTFIRSKQPPSGIVGHKIEQSGGAFSTNTQTVTISGTKDSRDE